MSQPAPALPHLAADGLAAPRTRLPASGPDARPEQRFAEGVTAGWRRLRRFCCTEGVRQNVFVSVLLGGAVVVPIAAWFLNEAISRTRIDRTIEAQFRIEDFRLKQELVGRFARDMSNYLDVCRSVMLELQFLDAFADSRPAAWDGRTFKEVAAGYSALQRTTLSLPNHVGLHAEVEARFGGPAGEAARRFAEMVDAMNGISSRCEASCDSSQRSALRLLAPAELGLLRTEHPRAVQTAPAPTTPELRNQRALALVEAAYAIAVRRLIETTTAMREALGADPLCPAPQPSSSTPRTP